MPISKPWRTDYPGTLDSEATSMGNVDNNVHIIDETHTESLRDAVIELETEVGTTVPAPTSLKGRVDTLESDTSNYVRKTTEQLFLWANGTTGDDANDGLTELTPKKTLQALFSSLPAYIDDSVVLNLRGTFSAQGTAVSLSIFGRDSSFVVIDGGDETTSLVGDRIATASTTNTITDSTLALTPNQYAGYWVEVVDGALAGHRVHIFEHTSDTFTFSQNLSSTIVGATFRIVRPATTIDGTSPSILRIVGEGQTNIIFQRLFFTGSVARMYLTGGLPSYTMLGVVWEGGELSTFFTNQLNLGAGYIRGVQYPFTLANTDTTQKVGFTLRSGTCTPSTVSTVGIQLGYLTHYAPTNVAICANLTVHINGTCSITTSTGYFRNLSTSYRECKLTSTPMVMQGSNIEIRSNTSISTSSTHAIELIRSTLDINATLSGTGNAGAGVYCSGLSLCYTPAGNPPTLTGTVGDISFDGTTSASTWAAVEAGTPATDLASFSSVKKG